MKKKLTAVICFTLMLGSCSTDLEVDNEDQPIEDSTTNVVTENNEVENQSTNTPVTNEKSITYGIDISKYQGDEVDFLDKKKDTLSFVICKGTEGNTYTDPNFKLNWKEIPEKGFIRGVYHFYRSADEPGAQSNNFLSVLGDLSKDDFPPIVDVEGGGIDASQSVEKVQNDLLSFLKIIEEKTGRVPIIYTNPSEGKKYFTSTEFSKYPLWIADYSGADEPRMPGAWKDTEWVMWQKSDAYQVDGKSNDFDVFNGGASDLKAFINKY